MLLELQLAITGTGVGHGLPSGLRSRERSTGTVPKPFLRLGHTPVLRLWSATRYMPDPLCFSQGLLQLTLLVRVLAQREGQRQVCAVTNSNSHRQQRGAVPEALDLPEELDLQATWACAQQAADPSGGCPEHPNAPRDTEPARQELSNCSLNR